MKFVTVVLDDDEYDVLVQIGSVNKMVPAQALVWMVGEYMKLRAALEEIEYRGGMKGHG